MTVCVPRNSAKTADNVEDAFVKNGFVRFVTYTVI